MIFLIMDVLHFLFWMNTVIHVLPEAPIQEDTGVNPKFYQKCQFKNLPDFIIWNKKINV